MYFFRFGSAVKQEHYDVIAKLLTPLHVIYSKVLLKATVQGLGLQPGLPEFYQP